MCNAKHIFLSFFLFIISIAAYGQADVNLSIMQKNPVGHGQYLDLPIIGFHRIVLNSANRSDTLYVFPDPTDTFEFNGLTPGLINLSVKEVNPIRELEWDEEKQKMIPKGKILGYELTPESECIHEDFDESFTINAGKNLIIVELLQKLSERQLELNPSLVLANHPMVSFRGDTLVYNTDLAIVENASFAIDVLKQLPGVEIQGRSIAIVGQHVSRTYINGALIFGYDPMNAFEYLKADQITSIESYMEDDPQDKIDGRKRARQRVLNIKTKEPIISVIDIQMKALGGADHAMNSNGIRQKRYLAGVEGRFFSENLLIKTGVSLNNLGIASFQYMTRPPSSLGGYSENISANVGFEQYWSDRFNPDGVKFNYDYSHNWSKSLSRALTERFEMNGIPAQEDEAMNSVSTLTKNHSIRSNLALGATKNVRFKWDNEITLTNDNKLSEQSGYTQVFGQDKMQKDMVQGSKQNSWHISENISMGFSRSKAKHNIGLNMSIGHEDINAWDIDTTASSYVKRYLTKDGEDIPVSFGGSYNANLFHIGEEGRMIHFMFNHSTSYSKRKSIQSAFDLYGNDVPVVNLVNTYDYTQSTLRNKTGLSFMGYLTSSLSINGSMYLLSDRVVDAGRIPQSNVNRPYWGIEPEIMISKPIRKDGRNQQVNFTYNAISILPSIEQLRDRINDSNPLNLVAGNPNIKKSVIHTVSSRYNILGFRKRKTASLYTTFSAGMTVNPIARKITFYNSPTVLENYGNYLVPAGATLNISENTEPSYKASIQSRFSDSYVVFKGKMRPTLALTPSISYSDRPQYFGDRLDRTSEFTPSISMNLKAVVKSFDMSISGSSLYTHAWNSDSDIVRNFTNSIASDITKHMFKYAVLGLSYSITNYTHLQSNYSDRTIQRLGASVGLELFKGNLQITMSGYDLLNGGSAYSIVTGPSSVTQTWNPVYGRYFLFGATWRFNSSGGKAFLSRAL